MKKAFLIFAFSCLAVRSDVLLNDTFPYPNGILQEVSNNKWVGHSGETNQVVVTDGAVNLTGKETQDVNAGLSNAPFLATSGVILYTSFKINFSALPTKTGSYFAHFKNTSSSGFRGRIWSVLSADKKINLGISSASSSDPAIFPLELDLNTDHLVVMKLDVGSSQATLWIDPVVESDPSVQSDTGAGITITAFALRQSSGMGTLRIDDLVVATTFEEAMGQLPKSPTILQSPVDADVLLGTPASFTVQAEGAGPLSYQWLFNDLDIPGATDSTLTLPIVTQADAGVYKVRVSNAGGSILSESATLSVRIPVIPPEISGQPVGAIAETGGAVSFLVIADGSEPLAYQWFFNDEELEGQIGSTLNISNLTPDQSGAYKVKVANSAGFVFSEAVVLTVRDPEIAPSIIQPPQNLVVELGGFALLSVVASGTEPLNYQWLFNGMELPGETGPTLTFLSVTLADAGEFTVRIANAKGTATSQSAALTVHIPTTPPTITQLPEGAVAETGASVALTVIAEGTEPLIYQWYKDGAFLAGQTTPILSLQNLSTNDSGSYSVSIVNEAGSAESEPVFLQVHPPVISTPPVISFTNYLSNLIRPGDLETNTFAEHALQPGETLRIDIEITDPDGRDIVALVNTNGMPPEAHWILSLDTGTNLTGTFEFTPVPESAGQSYVFRIEARDGLMTNQMDWSFYVPNIQEQNLVLTEFLANPESSEQSPYFNPLHRLVTALDPPTDDQYLEIVNFSSDEMDLAGWTISDSIAVRHRFSQSFSLQSSNVVVIYGGPLDGSEPILEATSIPASESSSGLNLTSTGGDYICIRNTTGNIISRVAYGHLVSSSSMTRYPDENGAFFPQESLGTNLFSPGKKWNGGNFAPPPTPSEIGQVAISRMGADEVHLTWQAHAGQTYSILRASSIQESFTQIADGLEFSDGLGEYTEAIDRSIAAFYIVISP